MGTSRSVNDLGVASTSDTLLSLYVTLNPPLQPPEPPKVEEVQQPLITNLHKAPHTRRRRYHTLRIVMDKRNQDVETIPKASHPSTCHRFAGKICCDLQIHKTTESSQGGSH